MGATASAPTLAALLLTAPAVSGLASGCMIPVRPGATATACGPLLRYRGVVDAAGRARQRLPAVPVVMMAKKKKGKSSDAATSLEALEAWEGGDAADDDDDDDDEGLTPVTVAKVKKVSRKAKKSNLAPAALAALEALEAMESAAAAGGSNDPFAPVAPALGKKKPKRKDLVAEQSRPQPQPAAAAAPPAARAGPTLADKVRAVCEQLGVDASQPVPAALKACNEAMGVAGVGPLLAQADELVSQLGLSLGAPAAAPTAAPAAAPAVAPAAAPAVAPAAGQAGEKGVVAPQGVGGEEVAEEAVPETLVEEVVTTEVEVEEKVEVALVEVGEEEEASEEQRTDAGADNWKRPAAAGAGEDSGGVTISKKKQAKPKRDPAAEDTEGVAVDEPRAAGTDTSGRRGMGTRIQRFEDAEPGFAYVKMDGGKLRFRNQDVLVDASWDLQTGQRIGLVGNNGAGKTTQLKVLAGELVLDAGEIIKSRPDIKIAMLRQEFREDLRDNRSLRDEFLSVFSEVEQLKQQYAEAEAKLSAPDVEPDAMQSALDAMSDLQAKLDAADAGSIEKRADRMIQNMGFAPGDEALPVSAFSGGWKMRIGLGKALLREPQVLLLDEPTNHMDLESVEWLEKYLQTQTEKLALVIVSHDREFLDRVCTKMVETEYGVTHTYPGNYRNFLKLKEDRVRLAMERWEARQKEIRAIKGDISRLRNTESAAVTVRAKERALKDMEPGGPKHVPRPFTAKARFAFRFPPAPRCSKEVIELEGVSHGYNGGTLFKDIELCIERGDRIAIIGPNGAGKSTLLRLIMGTERPRDGRAEIVAQNAVMRYFEQDQANALPLDKSVLQTVQDASASTEHTYEELRALLGKFMFNGEKVEDKLSTLSGGEKARVALCRMLLEPCNLLLLDEPTNHLDIAAKEVLEEALQNFEGTVVMVSHDRFFLSQTANTILALENGELAIYEGDYKTYLEQQQGGIAEKVADRHLPGGATIKAAPKIELQPDDEKKTEKKKKNFGGKGGPSGNKMKGIKNAKRMSNV